VVVVWSGFCSSKGIPNGWFSLLTLMTNTPISTFIAAAKPHIHENRSLHFTCDGFISKNERQIGEIVESRAFSETSSFLTYLKYEYEMGKLNEKSNQNRVKCR